MRIAGLRRSGHAALSYFLSPYDVDCSDGDWHLIPLHSAAEPGASWPAGCDGWGGAVRAALPPGAGPEDLALRIAFMLRPLEAHHCAQLPDAVERRASLQKFLPVLPRYTAGEGAACLVQDLYRFDGAADLAFVAAALAFVAAALGSSLAMLGVDRRIFDPMIDALCSAPTAGGTAFAAEPNGAEAVDEP